MRRRARGRLRPDAPRAARERRATRSSATPRSASASRGSCASGTGAAPRELRFLRTDEGLVAFLTLGLDPSSTLAEAHARASEVEERIRARVPRDRRRDRPHRAVKLCMFTPRTIALERGWAGRIEGDRVVQLAAQTLQSFFTGGGSAREHAEYPLDEVQPARRPCCIRRRCATSTRSSST